MKKMRITVSFFCERLRRAGNPCGADTSMTELDHLKPESPQPLTPEELARYRELLTLAYPQPKRDIRSAVMAQIREETAAGAKILTPKKKNLRKAALRWGSLAACVALVLLIGVAVLPNRLMKTADSAAPEYAMAEEAAMVTDEAAPAAPAEIAGDADSDEGSADSENAAPAAQFTRFNMAPDETPAEEPVVEEACEEEACAKEAEFFADAVAPEPTPEAACATANEAADLPMEKSMMAASPSAWAAVSDYAHHCEYSAAFRDSYHFIPAALISLVGEEAYARWEGSLETCVNLPDFAIAFGLTAEEIWNVGNLWYYVDLPEDIPLTAENRDAIREYYRDGGDYAEMVRRYTEYEYKNALISLVGVTEYTRWNGGASLRSWTADDLSRDFGLTDDQLRAAYDKAAAKVAAEYPGDGIPPYDKLVGE